MSKKIKSKILQLLDNIDDNNIPNQVMEDVSFYANEKDITDDLTPTQWRELDRAIAEADKLEVINWDTFKEEMNEWKEK